MKKKVYVDMDGVLCDFYGASVKAKAINPAQPFPQSQWGFFLKLEEIEDAVESYRLLETKYDVWILTRPSLKNVNCYTEKIQWVWDHLGEDVAKKTILIPDKSLVKGDYLIDDQGGFGQEEFEGEWLHFGQEKFPNWRAVVECLMSK